MFTWRSAAPWGWAFATALHPFAEFLAEEFGRSFDLAGWHFRSVLVAASILRLLWRVVLFLCFSLCLLGEGLLWLGYVCKRGWSHKYSTRDDSLRPIADISGTDPELAEFQE